MPNWCDNTIIVTGKVQDVKKFAEAFKGLPARFKDDLSYDHKEPMECFNALYPIPEDVLERGYYANLNMGMAEFRETIIGPSKPRVALDGYHWSIRYWGTKWDVYGQINVSGLDLFENADPDNEIELVYSFDTAWSPPINWLVKVAKDFPENKFELRYYEPGCGFAGSIIVKGDEILSDNEYTYASDSVAYKTFIEEVLGYENEFYEEDEEFEEAVSE
jgi:hypothetical protein